MLYLCLLTIPFLQQPAPLELQLARVVADDPRHVAAAQVPLPALAPRAANAMPAGATWTDRALGLRARLVDREVDLVLDAATDGGPRTRLFVDADADRAVDAGEILAVAWEDGFAEADLAPLGIPARLMLFERPGGIVKATARTLYHFRAEAEFDGVPHALVVIDMDLDGVASRGDRWICSTAPHLAKISLGNAMFMARELDEPWFVGAQTLTILETLAGSKLRLRHGAPLEPRHVVLARRNERNAKWFDEQFDLEREQFLTEQRIDPTRPRVPTPLEWYHTDDFADAQAYAARVSRPLYVEFVTGGCPWCKRLQWLNYRDAAVAARLRDFALVRLDNDLDVAGTAERLGLQGVPQGAVFDAAGKILHRLRGWAPPAEHAEALDAARQAAGLAPVGAR